MGQEAVPFLLIDSHMCREWPGFLQPAAVDGE